LVSDDKAPGEASGAPQRKQMTVDVRVIGLPGERLVEAAGLLARCFQSEPNFVNFFPEEGARSRARSRMFAAGLRDALGFGYVYAAMRGVEGGTRDELAGVAVWLPPGAFPLSAAWQLRALPGMAGVLLILMPAVVYGGGRVSYRSS
jgi:hypothetical protein